MKRQTTLESHDAEVIYNFIDTGEFGDCIQDQFLHKLKNFLSTDYNISGMSYPSILFDLKEYVFAENYRTIEDVLNQNRNMCTDLNHPKVIFAYFDHPIPKSPLYLAIVDKDMKKVLLHAMNMMSVDYKTTPIDTIPMTIKIDMTLFRDGKAHKTFVVSSLEYVVDTDEIRFPQQLFDVDDILERPENIFDSPKYSPQY